MITEYSKWDATETAKKIKNKDVSAAELASHAIQLIEKWNPKLNAVVLKMYDEGKKLINELDPQAPLYGVPFLIKDISLAYKGFPLTGSCKGMSDYVPTYDSELMLRYKKAGLIVLGKTNVPECGLKGVTDSEMRGVCRNPWNLGFTPGGSSGGSAAVVAARIVPVAHANDGGGSIRIPASCCGLIGLKPSRGRMPMGPEVGESWMGQVADHVVTRSVRDSALLLDLTHGSDPGSPYTAPQFSGLYTQSIEQPFKKMRIAYSFKSLYGKQTHAECKKALEHSIELCKGLGHELVEKDLAINQQEMVRAYMTIVAASMAAEMREIERQFGKVLGPNDMELPTWILVLLGRALQAGELAHAVYLSRKAGRALGQFFDQHDFFMLPTMAYPPTAIGELDFSIVKKGLMQVLKTVPHRKLLLTALDQIVEESFEKIPNTELFNQTGLPAISVPLFWGKNNLPIGTQFVSAYGREDQLLWIARELEKANPWVDKFPLE